MWTFSKKLTKWFWKYIKALTQPQLGSGDIRLEFYRSQ